MTAESAAALATWRTVVDRLGRDHHAVAWLVIAVCVPDPQPRCAVTADPEHLVTGLIRGTQPRPAHWPPHGRLQTWTVPLALTARVLALECDVLLSRTAVNAAGVVVPPAVAWGIRRAVDEDARRAGQRRNRRARRAARRHQEREGS